MRPLVALGRSLGHRTRSTGLSKYPEIARELTTSELVIRKRVSRGLATLRREVEKEKQI